MILSSKEMDAIQEHINHLVDRAMELGCDSVRVICSASMKEESTAMLTSGAGNLYAQHGSVTSWLEGQKDIGTAQEIANALNNDQE